MTRNGFMLLSMHAPHHEQVHQRAEKNRSDQQDRLPHGKGASFLFTFHCDGAPDARTAQRIAPGLECV